VGGGCLNLWVIISVSVWLLGGCVDGCVGMYVVVGRMCRWVSGGWVDVWMDVSLDLLW